MQMYRKIGLVVLILLYLSISPGSGQQDVYMKIQTGGFQPIRISIPPFTSKQPTDLAMDLHRVVVSDLELSSFFRIIQNQVNDPPNQNSGTNSTSKAEVKLEGELDLDDYTVSISAKLIELPGENSIFNKRFESPVGNLRWLGHRLADEVVYYLIGERGIASTQIAFASGSMMEKEIALVDYDGQNLRKLTDSKALNISPNWSPDGKYLTFTSYITGNPDLVKMNMSDGKLTWISKRHGLHTAPAWSPDGKKIAFTFSVKGNTDIYTMKPDGKDWRRLTESQAIDSAPSWSPTGNQIVFTSDRSGNPQIYIMDAEGGNVRRLTYDGNYNDSPVWSPRGDRIAYVSREEGRFQIYTVDINGSNPQLVTDGSGNNENPSWSPDGLKIAFASDRDYKWDIYIINWDGTNLRRVTNTGNNVTPEWSPRLKLK